MKKNILFITFMFISLAINAQNFTISKTFPGIRSVRVEGQFLEVEVTGGANGSVSLKGEIEGDPDDFQIRYDVSGSSLRVWIETPRFSFRSVDGYIKLQIPDDGNYNIKTSSGRMKVHNLKANDMKFATTSGSMQADNLIGTGELVSTSGSIRFSESNGDFEVVTTSGSIRIDGYRGDLEAASSSGSSYFNAVNGNITAVSSSGSINLQEVNGKLNLQSSSGSIKGELVKLADDSKFQTSSGGIRIDLVNDLDRMSFNCTASSGRIKVGNIAQGQTVILNNGAPKITAVSSSGGQQYY